MIFLKTDEEIELMRESNKLLGMAYGEIAKAIAPGVSTAQLDKLAEEFIRDHGGIPSCKGYEGYPATLCTSVNEQIVHGIPSNKVILKEGDIISVDCGTLLQGFNGDSCYTFCVGEVKEEVKQLLKTTKESLYLAIRQAISGNRFWCSFSPSCWGPFSSRCITRWIPLSLAALWEPGRWRRWAPPDRW